MTSPTLASAVHEPPASVRVRGSLALVAGAGETARVYERFGRRIAADGYVVGVFEGDATAAAEWLGAQDADPRVVVGSDRGAAEVLALIAAGGRADGVIVVGTPVAGADDATADAAHRTACPVHLGVLEGADSRTAAPGTASVEIPDAGTLAAISVPVLAIHGGADTIAPFDAAARLLQHLPNLELVETVDGLHDALNDVSHRSVAATIVLWLERLRGAGIHTPIVRSLES